MESRFLSFLKTFLREFVSKAFASVSLVAVLILMIFLIKQLATPSVEVFGVWNGPDQEPDIVKVLVWENGQQTEKSADWLKNYSGTYNFIYFAPSTLE